MQVGSGHTATYSGAGSANQRWWLDFVSDAFEDEKRFRMSCILDDCTREALATVVDHSLPGAYYWDREIGRFSHEIRKSNENLLGRIHTVNLKMKG